MLTALVGASAGAAAIPAGQGAVAHGSAPASSAVLTPKQLEARNRALRNCRRIESKKRRSACVRKVRKRFARPAAPAQGPIAETIDVRDKYFSPAAVSIRSGQSILWDWGFVNADAHNVDLISGPEGVRRLDFSTPNSPSVNFQFRRTFKVPGKYDFVCSIHYLMTMTVEVSP
jgi:plastocyanin